MFVLSSIDIIFRRGILNNKMVNLGINIIINIIITDGAIG